MSSTPTNSRGAVDLSGIAERAKQPQSTSGGAGGASYVIEVTEQTFDNEVLRKSLNHPVIVEFYSPRAQGAEQLSAALAELATEAAGKYLVARMNVDTAPQFAQAIGLQAVPTVVGALQGQLIPLFQGVVDKEQIRAALDQVIKAAVANGIIRRAEPTAQAPADADQESGPDPRFAAAYEAMETGDFAAAVEEFDKLLQANPQDSEAEVGKAQAALLLRTAELDADAVLAAAAAPVAPIEAQLAAADAEMAVGNPEDAFARLVGVIRKTAGDDRNAVRVRLLELFETLGNSDPRVQKARRDLMTALF
ncbi:MAG: tetratricopeptide repeat protein [Microlunatus sp.]|nr:tetratricopeptide repeat protein [Microlunatus sp.]